MACIGNRCFHKPYEYKLNSDVTHITEELASLLIKPMWIMDYDMVANIFQAYCRSGNLVSMRIEDSRKNVIFQRDIGDSSELISRSRIITNGEAGAEIGSVKLSFSTKHYKQIRETMIITIIAVSFFIIINHCFRNTFRYEISPQHTVRAVDRRHKNHRRRRLSEFSASLSSAGYQYDR